MVTDREILEAVLAEVRGLGTRMDGLESRMDGLDSRMDGLDSRMNGLDAKMDGLDSRNLISCHKSTYLGAGLQSNIFLCDRNCIIQLSAF